jgi:hypothetical protein
VRSVRCAGRPPSVNEGNKGLPPPSPPVSFMEKAVVLNGEGGDGKFSSFLIFSPLFDFFSQHFFLHCYLVSYNGCSLSVHQGNKGLPPQSPPCKLCGEGGDGKFSSCFFSPFQFFSQHFFPLRCYSVGCLSCPPSVNQGNKGLPPPSPPVSFVEKAVVLNGEGGDGEFSSF